MLAWFSLLCLGLTPAAAEPAPTRILAASSLTEVLTRSGEAFAEQTGQPVPLFTFGGSSRLSQQLMDGAQADVVATADPQWMDRLEREGLIVSAERWDWLENRLVVAIPTTTTTGLDDLSALRDEAWGRVSIAGPAVPAGRYAREALARDGVLEDVSDKLILTANVRSSLMLVAQREVDAGFVYRTDALAESRVRVAYTVPAAHHRQIRYPIALTVQGQGSESAQAFVAFLQSTQGRQIAEAAGFKSRVLPRDVAVSEPVAIPPAAVGPPLGLSLWVASVSLLLSIVPAIGLGWLMASRTFPGKALLSTVLLAPLILPPVVTGYLLLRCFSRTGWLGPFLESLGLQLVFTRWGAVIAAAVVGFPLLLILVRQAIESIDPRYPAIAQTLGLTPFQAFWRVTLPMALPGIAAGCVLAFARALGEFGATAMIAGDQPGQTRTLALAVYALVEQPGGEAPAATLVWVSLGVCFLALVVYERLVWRQRRRSGRSR